MAYKVANRKLIHYKLYADGQEVQNCACNVSPVFRLCVVVYLQ
jgi:hypothetical protein